MPISIPVNSGRSDRPEHAVFHDAAKGLGEAFNMRDEEARNLLDSQTGRHLMDHVPVHDLMTASENGDRGNVVHLMKNGMASLHGGSFVKARRTVQGVKDQTRNGVFDA